MTTVTFSGTGILSGTHDPDEIDRRIDEDRRKASAAAELAAEREATLDEIEKAISVYVADELQAEFAEQKQSEETRKRAHLGSFLDSNNTAPDIPLPCHTCPPHQRLSQLFWPPRWSAGKAISLASAPQYP